MSVSTEAKVDLLLATVFGLTGLNLDDVLRAVEGTEEEQATAQMENVIKMSEYMKLGK